MADWSDMIYIDHFQMLKAKGEAILGCQLEKEDEEKGQGEERLFLTERTGLDEDEEDDTVFSKA
jgi:hypothetical protein